MIDTYKDRGARKKLVQELAGRGISDQRVLDAMMKVPRHFFFSKTFHAHAYVDKAFPIGEGQTISQPYTVAYQTQVLHAEPGNRVLEIGTGSGYQAAVLMEMGVTLFTVERQPKLHERAKALLTKMGYKFTARQGDGTGGWPEHAPYDRIIVTAGAPVVPQALVRQLRIGGILVIPVGTAAVQKMCTLIRKSETETETIELDNFSFVPLIGSDGWKG